MRNCIQNCVASLPWFWIIGAAVVFAIIAAIAAATGGLSIVVMGVTIGIVWSAIVAAALVFGVTLSIPVLSCIVNCAIRRG
jgi:hypothetical protein